MKNKINAFATSCYRITLGIKRLDRMRNTQIHEITNTQSLINTVMQRKLRFLGRIVTHILKVQLHITPHMTQLD